MFRQALQNTSEAIVASANWTRHVVALEPQNGSETGMCPLAAALLSQNKSVYFKFQGRVYTEDDFCTWCIEEKNLGGEDLNASPQAKRNHLLEQLLQDPVAQEKLLREFLLQKVRLSVDALVTLEKYHDNVIEAPYTNPELIPPENREHFHNQLILNFDASGKVLFESRVFSTNPAIKKAALVKGELSYAATQILQHASSTGLDFDKRNYQNYFASIKMADSTAVSEKRDVLHPGKPQAIFVDDASEVLMLSKSNEQSANEDKAHAVRFSPENNGVVEINFQDLFANLQAPTKFRISLEAIFEQLNQSQTLKKIKLKGLDAIPEFLYPLVIAYLDQSAYFTEITVEENETKHPIAAHANVIAKRNQLFEIFPEIDRQKSGFNAWSAAINAIVLHAPANFVEGAAKSYFWQPALGATSEDIEQANKINAILTVNRGAVFFQHCLQYLAENQQQVASILPNGIAYQSNGNLQDQIDDGMVQDPFVYSETLTAISSSVLKQLNIPLSFQCRVDDNNFNSIINLIARLEHSQIPKLLLQIKDVEPGELLRQFLDNVLHIVRTKHICSLDIFLQAKVIDLSEVDLSAYQESILKIRNACVVNKRIRDENRLLGIETELQESSTMSADFYAEEFAVKIRPEKLWTDEKTALIGLGTQEQQQEQEQEQQQEQQQEQLGSESRNADGLALQGVLKKDCLVSPAEFDQAISNREITTQFIIRTKRAIKANLFAPENFSGIKFLTPAACQIILDYLPLFAGGLILDNLPEGFFLQETEDHEIVLDYSPLLQSNNKNRSALTLQFSQIARVSNSDSSLEEFDLLSEEDRRLVIPFYVKNQVPPGYDGFKLILQKWAEINPLSRPLLDSIFLNHSSKLQTFNSLQFNRLFPIFLEYGCAGINKFLDLLNQVDKRPDHKPILDMFLINAESYSVFLDADTEQAISTLCTFSNAQLFMFEQLLSKHLSHNPAANFAAMVNAYHYFLVEYKKLTGEDIPHTLPFDSTSIVSLPIALDRYLTILRNSNEPKELVRLLNEPSVVVGQANTISIGPWDAYYASFNDGFCRIIPEQQLTKQHADFHQARAYALTAQDLLQMLDDNFPVAHVPRVFYRTIGRARVSLPKENYQELLEQLEFLSFTKSFVIILANTSTHARGLRDLDANVNAKYEAFFTRVVQDSRAPDAYEKIENIVRFIASLTEETFTLSEVNLIYDGLKKLAENNLIRFITAEEISKTTLAKLAMVFAKCSNTDISAEQFSQMETVLELILEHPGFEYMLELLAQAENCPLTIDTFITLLSDLRRSQDVVDLLQQKFPEISLNLNKSQQSNHQNYINKLLRQLGSDLVGQIKGNSAAHGVIVRVLGDNYEEQLLGNDILGSLKKLVAAQFVGAMFQSKISTEFKQIFSTSIINSFKRLDENANRENNTILGALLSKLDEKIQSVNFIEDSILFEKDVTELIESLIKVKQRVGEQWDSFQENLSRLIQNPALGFGNINQFIRTALVYFPNNSFPTTFFIEIINAPHLSIHLLQHIVNVFEDGRFHDQEKLTVARLICKTEINSELFKQQLNDLVKFKKSTGEAFIALLNNASVMFLNNARIILFLNTKFPSEIFIKKLVQANFSLQDIVNEVKSEHRNNKKIFTILSNMDEAFDITKFSNLLRVLRTIDDETLSQLAIKIPARLDLSAIQDCADENTIRTKLQAIPEQTRDKSSLDEHQDTSHVSDVINRMMDYNRGKDTVLPLSTRQQLISEYAFIHAIGFTKPVPYAGFNKPVIDLNDDELTILFAHCETVISSDVTKEAKKLATLVALATAREVMFRATGMFPYSTQILVVLNALEQGMETLSQVNTGQGKGISAALFATIKRLHGATVDVSSVNPMLVERDLKQFKPYYQRLGIPCSARRITSDSDIEDYCFDGINYGRSSDIAIFRARMQVEGKWKKPKLCALVLDEVDYTLFDDLTMYRFAKNLSGIVANQDFWQWLYQSINVFADSDIFLKSKCTPEQDIQNLRHFLLKSPEIDDYKRRMVGQFSNEQLDKWIKSSCRTKYLQADKHYKILPIDPNDPNSPKVIRILDTETSEVKGRAQWDKGVHQLLTARVNAQQPPEQQLKIDPEVDAVASVSGKNFVDYYDVVCGLTGTLGDEEELQEIRRKYGFRLTAIPPHQGHQRVDEKPVLKNNPDAVIEADWAIIKKNNRRYRNQEGCPPTLIICDDIKAVKKTYDALKAKITTERQALSIQFYDGSTLIDQHGNKILSPTQDQLDAFILDAGDPKVITIATPIFARGVDIKPKHVAKLSVINNAAKAIRIIDQIKGRAGRLGEIGFTYQIYDATQFTPVSFWERLTTSETERAQKRLTSKSKQITFDNTKSRLFNEVKAEMLNLVFADYIQILNAISDPEIAKNLQKYWVEFNERFDQLCEHQKRTKNLFSASSIEVFNGKLKAISAALAPEVAQIFDHVVINRIRRDLTNHGLVLVDTAHAVVSEQGKSQQKPDNLQQAAAMVAANKAKTTDIKYSASATPVSFKANTLDIGYLIFASDDALVEQTLASAVVVINKNIDELKQHFPRLSKLKLITAEDFTHLNVAFGAIITEMQRDVSYPFASSMLDRRYLSIMSAVKLSKHSGLQAAAKDFHDDFKLPRNSSIVQRTIFHNYQRHFEEKGFYANMQDQPLRVANPDESKIVPDKIKTPVIEEINRYRRLWIKARDRSTQADTLYGICSIDNVSYETMLEAINNALKSAVDTDKEANARSLFKRNSSSSRYVAMLERTRDLVLAGMPSSEKTLIPAINKNINEVLENLKSRLALYGNNKSLTGLSKALMQIDPLNEAETPQANYHLAMQLQYILQQEYRNVVDANKRDVLEIVDLLLNRVNQTNVIYKRGADDVFKSDESRMDRAFHDCATSISRNKEIYSSDANTKLLLSSAISLKNIDPNQKKKYQRTAIFLYHAMLKQFELSVEDKLQLTFDGSQNDVKISATIHYADKSKKIISCNFNESTQCFLWKDIHVVSEPAVVENPQALKILSYNDVREKLDNPSMLGEAFGENYADLIVNLWLRNFMKKDVSRQMLMQDLGKLAIDDNIKNKILARKELHDLLSQNKVLLNNLTPELALALYKLDVDGPLAQAILENSLDVLLALDNNDSWSLLKSAIEFSLVNAQQFFEKFARISVKPSSAELLNVIIDFVLGEADVQTTQNKIQSAIVAYMNDGNNHLTADFIIKLCKNLPIGWLAKAKEEIQPEKLGLIAQAFVDHDFSNKDSRRTLDNLEELVGKDVLEHNPSYNTAVAKTTGRRKSIPESLDTGSAADPAVAETKTSSIATLVPVGQRR